MTTVYHSTRITCNGDWYVRDSSTPSVLDCSQHRPEGTTTDHPAMDAVQQPRGWALVGVIEEDDDFSGVYGVFAIDLEMIDD